MKTQAVSPAPAPTVTESGDRATVECCADVYGMTLTARTECSSAEAASIRTILQQQLNDTAHWMRIGMMTNLTFAERLLDELYQMGGKMPVEPDKPLAFTDPYGKLLSRPEGCLYFRTLGNAGALLVCPCEGCKTLRRRYGINR